MNILLVYKEADIATYKMLEGLSKLEDFNIYIASPPIVYRQKDLWELYTLGSAGHYLEVQLERYSCPAPNHQDLSDRPNLLAEQFRFIKRFIRLHRHTGEEYRIPRYAG